MLFKKLATTAIAVTIVFSVGGCASIVSKSEWPVTIQSNPAGAKCTITKPNGLMMHSGEAPMTVTLPSSKGFFSAAEYKIACNKDGFLAAESTMEGRINGWYLGGNLIFGGIIGYLIVDPATGAMWRLDEAMVLNLTETTKSADATKEPSLIP